MWLSVNFLCFYGTLSTFANFLCGCGTFRQLPSTFRAAAGPSINFCQLSVRQQDLPSTLFAAAGPSVNLLCSCSTFCQLPLPFCAAWDFLSILHALAVPSVNFRHLSMPLETFHQLSMWPQDLSPTFRAVTEPTVNFQQHSVQLQVLSSTFRAAEGSSVTFACCLGSTSVTFLCCQGNFHQLLSTFHATSGPSINFHQPSVQMWVLL